MGDGHAGKELKKIGIKEKYNELGLEEWYTPQAYQKVYTRFLEVFLKIRFILVNLDLSRNKNAIVEAIPTMALLNLNRLYFPLHLSD
ncbi:hypothetical protein ABFY48_00030 [Lysinibacillus pakistanensis]|uniref:hypothetical protein n=1 Tax=Lysinibacillus pakistanensis TaxID=759811 RepID=UPI003D28FE10